MKKKVVKSLSCVWLFVVPMNSSVHAIVQARILEWVSHSLLQGIFSSWEFNQSFLNGRHILYYLSQQGTPDRNIENESESLAVVYNSLWLHGLYRQWNSPVQNNGVGSHSLLHGIFPTQGLNPGLPCCRQILHQLNHKGSPRILEWVAFPFSRESFWPRN